MVQYLVILLDDSSVSFCHYDNHKTEHKLMPLDILKQGIFYGMKENLNIQFVYPDYELPKEYEDVIETIDHTKIKPHGQHKDADVMVIDGIADVDIEAEKTYVLRTTKAELFRNVDKVCDMVGQANRLNIVLTDVETFTREDFDTYKHCLDKLSDKIEQLYVAGASPQLNILTDRMMLDKMNNCEAGETNVTLAPDGRFYVCPAFYLTEEGEDFGLGKAKFSVGDLENGLDIKNPQLYQLEHSPICRHCDAYQCKRCVWLNRKTTYEVNTPSHEQCVVAHIERNASRTLLLNIRKHGEFLPDTEIKEIDYLDPLDIAIEWLRK